jgi:hypothetical protein
MQTTNMRQQATKTYQEGTPEEEPWSYEAQPAFAAPPSPFLTWAVLHHGDSCLPASRNNKVPQFAAAGGVLLCTEQTAPLGALVLWPYLECSPSPLHCHCLMSS